MSDSASDRVPSLVEVQRHLDAVARIAQATATAETLNEVLDALTTVLTETTGAIGVTVYRINPVEQTALHQYSSGRLDSPIHRLAKCGVQRATIRMILLSGTEAFFRDIREGEDHATFTAAFGEEPPEGLHGLARLPLRTGGVLHGVMSLRWDRPHEFTAPEQALLRDLASHAAAALRHSQLLERERDQRRHAETTANIARSVLGAGATLMALEGAVAAIAEAIPSEGYSLSLVHPVDGSWRLVAATGVLRRATGSAAPEVSSLPSVADQGGTVADADLVVLPLRVSGREIGVLRAIRPHRDGTGCVDVAALRAVLPSLALAADVVLLKEADDAGRARERMLASALNTMDQAVLLATLAGEVRYANPAAIRLFGHDEAGFADRSLTSLVDPSSPAPSILARATTPVGGEWLTDQTMRRRDETTFPAAVHLNAIRDDAQRPVGLVVVVRDLTDERRIADQLRQSEKLAALGELVAGVAHELNNPLAGISAFAQLLLEDPLDQEQAESVRLIKREADRAVAVIRDLLYFARKGGPSPGSVNLNELVEHTLRLRSYSLRSSGIDVRVELDPSLPTIPGDGQRLHQVVLNLVVNAEHAMQGADTRRLVVRTSRMADGVSVVVSDTGMGIPEDVRPRIFEPFFTTKAEGEGTGLGLSVSYGIVRAHGGDITVESDLGIGSSFRLTLPIGAASATSAA